MNALPAQWIRGSEPPYDAWWASVDPEVRAEAVKVLRDEFSPETVEWVRGKIEKHGSHEWIHHAGGEIPADEVAAWEEAGLCNPGAPLTLSAHHGWGTTVRNLLRDHGLTDDRLPQVRYDDQLVDGNWDDFYVSAIEEAVVV